jgi:hypothetical protein
MKNDLFTELKSLVAAIEKLPIQKRSEYFDEIENELKGFPVRNGDRFDGFVYRTKNLEQFKDVPGNRIINENSAYVRKLAESISMIGNVTPIIVNEKNETIDGQRRITAVRKFELPNDITYIRKKGTDINTVGEINQLQLKWDYKDWMHKYVTYNNPDYVEYKGIAEKYEKYMKSRSLRGLLMNNRVDSLPSKVWESGNFKINHEEMASAVNFLDTLKKVYNIGEKDNIFAKDRNFQKALFEVIKRTEIIDEKRLLFKIQYGFGRLNIKTDYPSYKKIIGELYNTRLSAQYPHIAINELEISEKLTDQSNTKRKYTKHTKEILPIDVHLRIKRNYTTKKEKASDSPIQKELALQQAQG